MIRVHPGDVHDPLGVSVQRSIVRNIKDPGSFHSSQTILFLDNSFLFDYLYIDIPIMFYRDLLLCSVWLKS